IETPIDLPIEQITQDGSATEIPSGAYSQARGAIPFTYSPHPLHPPQGIHKRCPYNGTNNPGRPLRTIVGASLMGTLGGLICTVLSLVRPLPVRVQSYPWQ